jgi:hypothetical protein
MNIKIIRDDSPVIRDHVEQYHYLHKYPDPRSLPFAYRIEVDGKMVATDGRLLGLLVVKKPQHHRQRNLFGYRDLPTSWQILDLARVWIHPQLQYHQSNGHSLAIFSRAVSRLWQPTGKPHQRLLRLQEDWLDHHPPRFPHLPYHIRILISYCQLEHHDGTGYKAAGFKSIGLSNDGEKEVFIRQLANPKYNWQPRGYYQKALIPPPLDGR